jgi:hypothetical protein
MLLWIQMHRPKITKNASAKRVTPNLEYSLSLSLAPNKAITEQGGQNRN